MDLDGGRWNLRKKRRRSKPGRILMLVFLIAAAVYVEMVIVPRVPPPFVPTPTPTRSPASFLLEAETFFEAGKLGQAQESYLTALEVDPLNLMTFVDLARVQVFAGDYEAAQESASNALLLDPDSALANAVYGWVLDFLAFEAKDYAQAWNLVRQAIEIAWHHEDTVLLSTAMKELHAFLELPDYQARASKLLEMSTERVLPSVNGISPGDQTDE